MAGYCTNCGAKLDVDARFCGSCGKPCSNEIGSRQPVRNGNIMHRSGSGGWWKFFAGGAIGAFLTQLFGSSHTTSASSYAEKAEQFHDTVIYHDDSDDGYSNTDNFHDNDDWSDNTDFDDDFDYDDD